MPWAGWATMLKVSVSPTSASVQDGAVEPSVSSLVVRVTSEQTGALFTELTVMLPAVFSSGRATVSCP